MVKETVSAADAQKEKSEGGVAPVLVISDDLRGQIVLIVGEVVNEKLSVLLDGALRDLLPFVLADEKFQPAAPSDDALKALIAPMLPDLIAELVPSVRAELDKAAADAKAAEDASAARKVAAKQAARAEKEAAAQLEKRAAAKKDAAERFAHLFGASAATMGIDLESGDRIGLLIDDGKAFCIDFSMELDAGDLVAVDGMLRLAKRVDLPADVEPFVVQGIVILTGEAQAMRCEIPTPLHVGGGRGAQLPADSLVFRAPIVAAADPA